MSDIDETAETGVSDDRGRRKTAELHTSGAKRAEQLGEGGVKCEALSLAVALAGEGEREGGLTTRRSIRAVELQPDSKTIQVGSKM